MSQKLKQLKEKLRRAIKEELVEYDNLNVQSEEEQEELEEASSTANLDGGEGPPKTPYAFQSKKKRAQDKKKEDEIVTNSTGFIKVNEAVDEHDFHSAYSQIDAGLDEAEYGFNDLVRLGGLESKDKRAVKMLTRDFVKLQKNFEKLLRTAEKSWTFESINEAKAITKGNRGVKVGDTVRFRDEHRRPVSQRVKVKWIMKAKPNKEKVDFNYITSKGTFHDQHLQGTKAWKLYYSKERRESVNETVTFRGARGRSVVVPNEYVGKLGRVEHKLMKMLGYTGGKHNIIADWSWGYNSRQKMKPNDEFSSSIILRSHPYIKGGSRELQKGDVKVIIVTLNKLLRANRLKIEKPKYRPDVNYPMIEFRVEPKQFKESVEEERDYKTEYKKYGSSTKAKKYRAELNQYNRKNGTYGNGDGKDASHKGGKIVGFEKESTNRGRAEKSRLKKKSVNERVSHSEAKVILSQLGGSKFIAMTGAKNFGVGNEGLSMSIGKNSKRITHFIVDYNRGKDLYNLEFVRVWGGKRISVKKLKSVYFDDLQYHFKKYTGLNTRF